MKDRANLTARAELIIFGRVQGVGFRFNILVRARRLGLTGWVMNETDETVRILAEGEKNNLTNLLEWCKNISGFAKVDKIEVKWEQASGEFKKFKIEK